MSRASLTSRQRQILAWIVSATRREGAPPTVREIGAALGMRSTGSVRTHLVALRRKGYLGAPRARRHRGLVLSRKAGTAPPPLERVRSEPEARSVPILGRVAAGPTMLAEENLEGTLLLGQELLPRSGDVFALRVKGESMIEAGIMDGDLVLVRSQPRAEAGEIVVAMVDGEVTVKYYRPEGGRIRLEPANPAMRPILLDAASGPVRFLGRVVGVVRQY